MPFNLAKLTPPQAEKVVTEKEAERPSVAAAKADAPAEDNGHAVVAGRAAWADLDVLCLTAIHKDTQQRYQSVEALLRDVDHFLKGEPLEARPDTMRYRLRKFSARHWRSLTVAGAAFALVAALVVFFVVRLANERRTTLAEAARTERIQQFMTNLFQGGSADAGPADNLRVVTLLDRGVQDARSLSAEPEIQAELYQTVGTLYENLGKFDEANRLLNLALDERRSLFGPEHPQVAESMVALGLLRDPRANCQRRNDWSGKDWPSPSGTIRRITPRLRKRPLPWGRCLPIAAPIRLPFPSLQKSFAFSRPKATQLLS